ncbi:hypothetical protein SAMD00023353_2600730 [Rosellinia necatrix]|uniref:Uncharacterized protein n=1 Tax=Rosellinia necatrix TaxID=77044 RepID=A0A1W2TH80_ROSNE|nr:hypothetical protein SAMD00023353_2600730 [Rosellinia necatrix]
MSSNLSLRRAIEANTKEFLTSPRVAAERNDPTVLSRTLTQDCRRKIVPASFMLSIGVTNPNQGFTNEQAQQAFSENIKVSSVESIDVHRLCVDEAARASAACTGTVLLFRDGERLRLETAWFLDFVDDGSRIKRIVEFCGEQAAHRRVDKTVRLLQERGALNASLIG